MTITIKNACGSLLSEIVSHLSAEGLNIVVSDLADDIIYHENGQDHDAKLASLAHSQKPIYVSVEK